jgi:hypothetical protein
MAQHGNLCTHASRGSYKQHVLELGREQEARKSVLLMLINLCSEVRMTSEVMRVGIVLCMFLGALVLLCENWVIGFEFSMH